MIPCCLHSLLWRMNYVTLDVSLFGLHQSLSTTKSSKLMPEQAIHQPLP